MSSFKTLDDLGDITGKVALVRVDLNLPMKDGSATDVSQKRVPRSCCWRITGVPRASASRP